MKLKNVKMGLFGCAFLFFLYSCEVEQIEPAQPVEEENVIDSTEVEKDKQETADSSSVEKGNSSSEMIGQGSGTLILKDISNKNYTIKPGTYTGLVLNNLQNVHIDGAESVIITKGNVDISDVNDLKIAGISIENHNQAAIYIHSSANNLSLDKISFKNISNYAIRFDVNKKYNGSNDSFSQNIHLSNITAENIGTLFISKGGIEADGFYGLIKGFKLLNSTVKNSPHLNGLTSLGLAEDYEMANNRVDNVNASDNYPNGNNNHTAIFYAIGNGKIHGNKITNHQGNAVRAWLITVTKPGLVEIYDNIVYNSTRYGAFELQVPPSIERLSTFKPANAKVYNNTVGRLNTGQPKFFEGRLLDLYQTHGEVEIYNNLSFELRDDKLINNMSDPKDTRITRETNNRYFKSAASAVHNLTNFKSKHSGIGAR